MADTPPQAMNPMDLIAALPASVLVLDGVGTVLWASPQAAALVGRTTESIIGESVLAFVDEQTAWAYAAAVAMATDYVGVTTGPLRITFYGPDRELRRADLWANNQLDDPAVGGIVCLLTEETAAVWLGEAVEALAEGGDLHKVAASVVTAMRGAPVGCDAVLLERTETGWRSVVPNEVPTALYEGVDGPWRVAADTGMRQLFGDFENLPAALREAALAAGYTALYTEPVPVAEGPCRLAMALWSRFPGSPSPNQLTSINQGASILALADRETA